jgi:glycerol kinase
MMGDQQSATLGLQVAPKDVKITYGTGCFMMQNTGEDVDFQSGFLSTVLLKLGKDDPAHFGKEAAIESGAAILNYFKDDLNIIGEFTENDEKLLNQIKNKSDFFFQNAQFHSQKKVSNFNLQREIYASETLLVPPLNGTLFSPYWKSNVHGQLRNLNFSSGQTHIYAAALETFCFRVKQCLDLMHVEDSRNIMLDGGITQNQYLVHYQANLLDRPLVRVSDVDGTMRGVFLGCLAFFDRKRFLKVLSSPLKGTVIRNTNNQGIKQMLLKKYNTFNTLVKDMVK